MLLVRLGKLPEHLAKRYSSADCPEFRRTPMADGPPLKGRRVAIISSAGLNLRDQPRFVGNDKDYRKIPSNTHPSDILMSHVSLGFDRTAFYQDLNTVLPVDRLRSLVRDGFIGSVADMNYSFMGGAPPQGMKSHAKQVANLLKQDKVDAVLMVPV